LAAGFLLALREGVEAALLIGITLGVLSRMHRPDLRNRVWAGVAVAVLLSVAAASGLQAAGATLAGRSEELFEAVIMLIAAGVLTWMIVWLQRQGRRTQTNFEAEVHVAAQQPQSWPIFLVALTAVLREGIEMALFLSAAALTARAADVLIGALLGLAAAVTLGFVLYASSQRLNVRRFFQATGILLMLFAAGLVAHAVHELNAVGLIPGLIAPLWDINHVLDESSFVGQLSKALFGYNADPSLSEALAYLVYFGLLGGLLLRMRQPAPPSGSKAEA
jgi:high-affinity iron transporter